MQKIIRGSHEYKIAIFALFFGSIVAFGAEYCVQPIIPVFTEVFNIDPAIASLTVSCGTAGMACAMILIAIFSKRLPRKKIMAGGLIISALLAILISTSNNFYLILILRFIQGMLLAGFPAMAVAYINEEFDAAITGTVVGIYIAGTSVGGLAGRMILSYFTDIFEWRTALMLLGGFYTLIGVAFLLTLPKPKHKTDIHSKIVTLIDFIKLLHNIKLIAVYIIAALVIGAFVCTYNFISFVLLAPPYNLSHTQVGLVYFLFLVGTLASAIMGRLSDSIGNGKSLIISIICMLIGAAFTLMSPLIMKLIGIAFITYGFFGSHSAACSWAGRLDDGDKACISALYMFFYYVGASFFGTFGGKFLVYFGWNGVVGFLGVILSAALCLNIYLINRR